MSRSSVGDVCRHRSSPHCLADSSSAVVDSHDGVWMPFVTWPIGTSAVGQRGKTDLKMCRLTSPWRRRTPFAAALPRMATYAMLNGSAESAGFSRPNAVQRPHPVRDGPPDLVRRIFLDVMAPRDLHLGQRWQPADEGDILVVGEDRTRLGPEEQLGHTARRQPVRGGGHDRNHVGGLALDGDLPGPRQRRPSPLAGLGERPSVLRHLLGGEGAQDGPWHDLLDEEVVSQDHLLAGLGTQRLQGWTHIYLVPVVPALRPHDRLHERDALHGLAVAVGPVEAEGRAPVMDDEGDPLAHIQGLEQGVEVAAVLDEAIRAGAAVRQLVGVSHAYQVGGDAAASWLQVRQHVAPEVRRGGIAVQQHDGVALSHPTYAISRPRTRRRCFWYGNAAEIMFASPVVAD